MNVLLVQPPDHPAPVKPLMLAGADPPLFAPPWDLLCLRSYLLAHTRHAAVLLDCRTFADFEAELVEALRAQPEPRLLVVKATSHTLGQTAAVIEIARRSFPEMRTVLCGEFPSQFPEQVASLAHVDFALAGDPEPILRNLLDYLDLPQRLQRVPGLIRGGTPAVPYWLDKLHALSLPDWDGIFWRAYEASWPTPSLRAEARLSRGHSRVPADRAFGGAREPLRVWPLDRLARTVQKCGAAGITEVFLSDPPGIWTPERLLAWCAALERIRNTQPWSLRLLPTSLAEETAAALQRVRCRRVEFLLPSCAPELLRRYGCLISFSTLAATMDLLRSFQIEVSARFWMGGPEERPGEPERVAEAIRALRYAPATLEPFPFCLDSPLYEECAASAGVPRLSDWIHWARDPWTVERPLPLWRGRAGVPELEAAFAAVQRAVARSPQRWLRRALHTLRSTDWIGILEDKAIELFTPSASRRP